MIKSMGSKICLSRELLQSPAYLSKNFAKANGTTCVMHSLTFRQETEGERHRAREARARIENAQPGEVVDLGSLVPLSVNNKYTQ